MTLTFDFTECYLSAYISLSKLLFQAYPNDYNDIYIRSDDMFVMFSLENNKIECVKYGNELTQPDKDFKEKHDPTKFYWIVKNDCPIIQNYEQLKMLINSFVYELDAFVGSSEDMNLNKFDMLLNLLFGVHINTSNNICNDHVILTLESICTKHYFIDTIS